MAKYYLLILIRHAQSLRHKFIFLFEIETMQSPMFSWYYKRPWLGFVDFFELIFCSDFQGSQVLMKCCDDNTCSTRFNINIIFFFQDTYWRCGSWRMQKPPSNPIRHQAAAVQIQPPQRSSPHLDLLDAWGRGHASSLRIQPHALQVWLNFFNDTRGPAFTNRETTSCYTRDRNNTANSEPNDTWLKLWWRYRQAENQDQTEPKKKLKEQLIFYWCFLRKIFVGLG